MPVKRRLQKRRRQISEVAWAPLNDQPPPPDANRFEAAALRDQREDPGSYLAVMWREHAASILARWIAGAPGTRPSCWWEFDAPRIPVGVLPGDWYDGRLAAPRERLGGIGTPDSHASEFVRGIPHSWVAVDWKDPPIFESEAAYLKRHKLLLPGEAQRLKAADFAPVAITPPKGEQH